MNKTQLELQAKIDDNIIKIKKLINLNNDLEDQKNLAGDYRERQVTRGTGVNKNTITIGEEYWNEDFKDQETGEVITIERSRICRIDGKPCDELGEPLVYLEV